MDKNVWYSGRDLKPLPEYSGDLKSGHVRISNAQSLSRFQMVRILNGLFSLDCLLLQTKNYLCYSIVTCK